MHTSLQSAAALAASASASATLDINHAQALRARGNALPTDGLPSTDILDSWVRCMQAGLDSAGPALAPVVEAADLARRRDSAAVTRRLARAELETLAQQIAGSNFLLAFADQDGVILDLYADNRFAMSASDAGILPGSCWRETLAGTSGLGTALSAGRAVAVTGLEHYFLALGAVSCTAAPVRDAHGQIVGVLDASSYFESRQRHTQALVQMAATHIENGLLLHQLRGHYVLAVHPRSEFLGTLSAGLLVFDAAGVLLARNARGQQLLQGLAATPGTPYETLFAEPFEQLLVRLHGGGELRLRDVLGSTLVASCISRPAERRLLAPDPARLARSSGSSSGAGSGSGGSSDINASNTAGSGTGSSHNNSSKRSTPPGLPPSAPAAGQSDDPAVAEAYQLVSAAVRLAVPVLILGETGSGKELLARHAHQASGRSGAFVAINCGALPAELFEAELFGYAGGAFTGARRDGSAGLIASAHGGTLLLDEVGDLPLPLQAALLRFLDDRLVRPVGGTQARRVDVQLLAATNTALDDAVATRRFRADLLYRLNTVCAVLPPLRLRRDLPAATRRLLATLDIGASITDDALQHLAGHPWPGNFRELRSVLTRALLGRNDSHLGLADVARVLPAATNAATNSATTAGTPASASALQQGASELVRRELDRSGGSVSQTARALGVSRTTVYRHMRGGRG